MLKLVVISASNLIDVDFGPSNKSDPYVKAIFRGESKKTDHIEDNLNPVWQHGNVLEWDVNGQALSSSDEIEVRVKDWEKILNRKLLGKVKISLSELLKTKDYTLERPYKLVDNHNRATPSKIVIRLNYTPSKGELEAQQYELQYMNEVSEEEAVEAYEEQGVTKTRKRRRRALKQRRREWSTKVQHYKIRVTIHEGRQLPGINISPIARVTVKHHKHQTRVKHSTNSPAFNQTFTFNFHTSEAELFDSLLVLEVFHSKNFIISNRLLGYFESDIGAIYEFPDHVFVRKWVLLTGTGSQLEDETETKQSRARGSDGETAGYLKVTAMVLGPGDESPPVLQHENEEEDIESNCLMPAGIVRQPAKFVLKVYQAEDIPRMDSGFGRSFLRWFLPGGGKETADEKAKLVDPYLIFGFCGKKVSTSIKHRQNNPTYNETLTLPLMLPSMCEKIYLRFFDWDRGSTPDIIATSFLSLSEISGQGDGTGFYPQFGPCFVNFYGSSREFSLLSNDDNFKDMDKGIGEGAAFRGRVLVELSTEQAGPDCQPSTGNLHDEDKIRIQPFLKQDHYKLFACFKDAAMISRTDGAIEFEVSIGNFGNTLDETAVSCNTPPTNAVYDGSYYHYLPWRHYKPCICLDCRWENIAFRIEPMNVIKRMCENLETLISQVKVEEDDLVGVKLLKPCLQHIITNCSNDEFLEILGVKNSLDYKIYKLRKDEFKFLVEDAKDEEEKLFLQGGVQVDLDNAVEKVEGFLQRLKTLAIEPQISMPDVIIWMLCGGERIAYHRVPIQDVLYSKDKEACGKYCGKTVELLMKYPGKGGVADKEHQQVPAMIRVELWVGLREHQHAWSGRKEKEGHFKVYAETYENESRGVLGWSSPGIGLRPHYSNASGDLELREDRFVLPKGWNFSGDWKPILETSILYGQDYGLAIFTEEIYEHQSRNLIGGGWNTKSHWTEADGEPSKGPDEFPRPEGWMWTSKEWAVDQSRAADEEGWEYSASEIYGGTYAKAVKPLHMTRRRRWVCTRELVDPSAERKQEKLKKLAEEGWEYGLSFLSKFHAKPRARDLVRRKRLLREMVRKQDTNLKKAELPPRLMINMKIKTKKSKKKKKEKEIKGSAEEEKPLQEECKEGHLPVIPRMFIVYDKPLKFQLWVYIYQARNLLALDDTGMSDPYVRVVFGNQSQTTEWKPQTTSPTWDQTLIFPHVEMYEKVENVVANPPNVIMEVFDWDLGKHDFIGHCMTKPLVQTRSGATPPVLQWISLNNGIKDAGQVLVAAELFLDEGVKLPAAPTPKKTELKESHSVLPVRDLVRPALQTFAVEILCWGVRNLEKYKYSNVNAPSVEFEWGDQVFKSEIENLKKCANFSKPNLTRKFVCLPVEPFTPAMNIRVYDNRMFNNKPLVGVHSISSLKRFISNEQPIVRRRTPLDETDRAMSPSPMESARRTEVHQKGDEVFDWWSKYYSSIRSKQNVQSQHELGGKLLSLFSSGDETDGGDDLDHFERAGYHTLKIFPKELEKVEEFGGLEDFVSTLTLKRGKSKSDDEAEDDNVGQLKASFWIHPIKEGDDTNKLSPSVYANLSETRWKWPIKCLVRAYVLCAFDLQSQDPNGLADPYLVVTLGNTTHDEQKNCQHNTLNPVFGKMFEFKASIPMVKDLKVKVKDYDRGTFDETVGETVIDLEQRLLSRLHASCGLPKKYYASGPCAWRDSKRPKDILKDFCRAKGYKHPSFYPKGHLPNTLVVETNTENSLSLAISDLEGFNEDSRNIEYPDQQLALLALHRLGMVPEHVETRSLYSSLQPQIEQGKLQMWVDIFPLNGNVDIQPAVRIEPREPLSYILRVIIWDTTDVQLQETTINGEKMSDIYVKGWINGMDDKQKTDVHYRSLDGVGNFNWRMIFPFKFLKMDKKITISKKTKLTHLYKTEEKVDPNLKIQIWEDDKFSPDDFLGTRGLALHNLARPCKSPRNCGTKYDPSLRKQRPDDFVDLFQCKSIRGWWACWKDDSLTGKPQGKVDMTIELLTEAEAQANQAGKGRDEPNQHPNLPEPNRPKTSFLWLLSPFKTMRYIVWKNYKWYIIGLIVVVLLALIIFLFVYSIPGYSVQKLFNI